MSENTELHDLVAKYKQLASELGKQPTSRDFWKVASNRKIAKYGFNKIASMAGFSPRIPTKDRSMQGLVVGAPRILYFDIEVSPMWVKTYSLKTDYISHKNIKRHWHIYSYAGIFEGCDKQYYLDNRYSKDISDDRQLIEGLHDLLSQADILVGHNIDSFDIKKFNTKAVKYGLDPISFKKSYDTLKMARKYFKFDSNSLDFIANYLELKERKSGHTKFPGDALWEGLEAGDLEAWDECQLYNLQDCRVTQELFKRLAPYDTSINIQAFHQQRACICGSKEFMKFGHTYTKSGKFQVYRCKSCGKKFTEKQNLIEKDMRQMLFK
jgi:hypothetical protein